MEFRWLTPEERRACAVESGSLAEVLALAQKLQAEGEELLTEEQVVEMGRELGIRPEYVCEALALRQRATQPARALQMEPEPREERPLAAVGQTLLLLFAIGLFPATIGALHQSHMEPVPCFALIAAAVTGWVARYPRLAAVGGALTVPITLCIGAFYSQLYSHSNGSSGMDEAIFFSLLSLGPLCSLVGRGAAKLRRWAERLTDRPEWMVWRS
jgi:hypothetical protein